jgi:predicted SAM-dependent methyltransferase
MKKLDLGCGSSKKPGYLGLDSLPLKGVDIVHNLEEFPYPFTENEIDEIWMDQVLEHIPVPIKVVEELYRICKNGAKIHIGVPYFRSAYSAIDPTHVNFFGVFWFNYFDPNHEFFKRYQYSFAKFHIDKIEFDRESHESKIGFFRKRMINYANNNLEKYELRWSHLYPLNSLTFHLTVIK